MYFPHKCEDNKKLTLLLFYSLTDSVLSFCGQRSSVLLQAHKGHSTPTDPDLVFDHFQFPLKKIVIVLP